MKCTTYIDESGNTGNNLTDKDQKLFIIAAVTIPETIETSVIDRIKEVFSEVKEIGETEIKATKWIRAPKKAAKLQEIIGFMREKGCHFGYEDLLEILSKLKAGKRLSSDEREHLEWVDWDKDYDSEALDLDRCRMVVKRFNGR